MKLYEAINKRKTTRGISSTFCRHICSIRAISIKIILGDYVILSEERSVIYEQ